MYRRLQTLQCPWFAMQLGSKARDAGSCRATRIKGVDKLLTPTGPTRCGPPAPGILPDRRRFRPHCLTSFPAFLLPNRNLGRAGRLGTIFGAPRGTFEIEHLPVMHQAIDQRDRQRDILDDARPVGQALVEGVEVMMVGRR